MYIGIGPNKNLKVSEDDALSFAMSACGIMRPSFFISTEHTEEFDSMLVEWFYSGNWLQEHSEESATEVEQESDEWKAREDGAYLYREWAREAI